jgi:glycerol-3-phosphate dehydrogenase
LLVVGGGINGIGIARDAAGRGLQVTVVEQDDLASATSSASTKLIHGGLRYLEYFDFRLVRESLSERERLLSLAPHLIRPLRFILPHMRGLRPRWQIRLGLFLYDHIGGREKLPASASIDLSREPFRSTLRDELTHGFVYSDCWVDDSRLVVLNAVDAAQRGATILPRTRFVAARSEHGRWRATCIDQRTGRSLELLARCIVNAAGPWVEDMLRAVPGIRSDTKVRLVKGSHIVVPRLYEGEHAFLLQHPDQRIVFAIPYEHRFTLIGTTDVAYQGNPAAVAITEAETRYLCETASEYFRRPIVPANVQWTYAGVRPLLDDAHADVSRLTRDYRLELAATADGATMLSVFGGKITTYRRLAQLAVDKLLPLFDGARGAWTDAAALPGGELPGGDFERFLHELAQRYSFLAEPLLQRLARAYGTRSEMVVGNASGMADLGEHFGAGLTEAEIAYLRDREWAQTAEDVLWRRTKLGLHLSDEERARVAAYMG